MGWDLPDDDVSLASTAPPDMSSLGGWDNASLPETPPRSSPVPVSRGADLDELPMVTEHEFGPAAPPSLGEERQGRAHGVAHDDGLLAALAREHLDLGLEPAQIAVAPLQVPEAQAPVVAGHVHRGPVVADLRGVREDFGPQPVTYAAGVQP